MSPQTVGMQEESTPRKAASPSDLPARRRALVRGLIIPGVAAAAFMYASWHITRNSHPTPHAEPYAEPARSPYVDCVAGVGLIEPQSESIEVAAAVPGTVMQIAARVGQRVEIGDMLFRIDDRENQSILAVQEAQLAEAEATLGRWEQMPRVEDLPPSEARVQRFKAQLELREDQLQRTRQLRTRQAATEQELVEHEQEFLAARADLLQAEAEDARLRAGAWKADLDVARAQVERCRQLVDQARVELDRLVVRAPIRGTILKVDVRIGEYVGTPPGKPLIVLGDIDTLHVRVDVDEHDVPRFRPGQSGRGFVRGEAKVSLPLRFVRVEPITVPKQSLTGAGNERIDTRVLQVIYAIESAPATVYVGQQIDVFLDEKNMATVDGLPPSFVHRAPSDSFGAEQ